MNRKIFLAIAAPVLLVSLIVQARNSWAKLREAREYARLDAGQVRAKLHGNETVAAYDLFRDAIPFHGLYLMADESNGDAGNYWLRYDLAPRRPILVSRRAAGALEFLVDEIPAGARHLILLEPEGAPPRLLDPEDYFRGNRPAREDGTIPSNVDSPGEGEVVHGPLTLAGWCQEPVGRPCQTITFWLDGELRSPALLERFPRTDVSATVEGIGPAPRAGFRARFPASAGTAGWHEAVVVFWTGDGRFRRSAPRRFRWESR